MRKSNVMLGDEQLSSQNPWTSCTGHSGLLRWQSSKESACQGRRCKRCRFNPWVRKIPWKRKWKPTPVFLPDAWRAWVVAKSLTQLSARSYTHRYVNASLQNANGETQIQIMAGTQRPGRFPAHLATASGPAQTQHLLGRPSVGSAARGPWAPHSWVTSWFWGFLASFVLKGPFFLVPQGREDAQQADSEWPFTEQWLRASYCTEQRASSSDGSPDFCPTLSSSFHAEEKRRWQRISSSKWWGLKSMFEDQDCPESFSLKNLKQFLGTHVNCFQGPRTSRRMKACIWPHCPAHESQGGRHVPLSFRIMPWAAEVRGQPRGSAGLSSKPWRDKHAQPEGSSSTNSISQLRIL